MAKRRMLQWMRERLADHADKVVLPGTEKKAMDAAYKVAMPKIAALVAKKFPPAEMKVLAKWKSASNATDVNLQLANGVVTKFDFHEPDYLQRPDGWEFGRQIFLADASISAAVEKWVTARDAYVAERKRRLTAYKALIDGAANVEDIIEVWPEARGILPAGSPPIPLGPEQIALVKADQRERKAA